MVIFFNDIRVLVKLCCNIIPQVLLETQHEFLHIKSQHWFKIWFGAECDKTLLETILTQTYDTNKAEDRKFCVTVVSDDIICDVT